MRIRYLISDIVYVSTTYKCRFKISTIISGDYMGRFASNIRDQMKIELEADDIY